MNEVTTRPASAALALVQNLQTGLANVRTALPTGGGDPFLRMLKDGAWVYGADDIEADPKSVWAVNPNSFEHGWIAWKDREEGSKEKAQRLGERMVPMTQQIAGEHELPAVSGGRWTRQVAVQLKAVSGPDKDQQTLYKTNSVGGTNAVGALIDALMKHLATDQENIVPLVKLSHDTYNHKQHGRTYVPILEIVDWMPFDGPTASPAPNTAAVAATEPEPAEAEDDGPQQSEPAVEEANPVRRRRRA